MYGILVSYSTYLEINVNQTVEDVLEGNNGIQGIFTGRNGDFMIIGKVLGTIENNNKPYVVPEIDMDEQKEIEGSICTQFGLKGEFHYYFIEN